MYEKYCKIIGRNIAYYRKKKHWNQDGLAMRANVSRSYISQIEAKNINKAPSLHMLIHLSSVLEIDPGLLFIERKKQ